MSVAVATDTFATKVAEPNRRLTAAEMADYTRPRAMLSTDPTVRLIGGMLLSHGGTWTGTTTELFERLVEETGDRGCVGNTMAANAAAFGKRFMALQRDLALYAVAVSNVRRKVDGFDRRRWVITATDCKRAERDLDFDAFAAEMLTTDGFDIQTAATVIRGSYLQWDAARWSGGETAPAGIPRQTFFRLLRDEAARRGAVHAVIDDKVVYKGLRLKRLPPPVGEAISGITVSKAGTTIAPDARDLDLGIMGGARIVATPEPSEGAKIAAMSRDEQRDIDAQALEDELVEAIASAKSARRWFVFIAAVCLVAVVWYAVA